MKRKLHLLLTLLLLAVCATGGAQTYSHVFKQGEITKTAGQNTFNNVMWSWTESIYVGFDTNTTPTKGVQIGSKKQPQKNGWTISTDGIKGTITSVIVNAATGESATLAVKVGSTDFLNNAKTSASLATTSKDYEFTGSATGTIAITMKASFKAMYIKSITVTYTPSSTTKTATQLTFTNTGDKTYTVGDENNAAVYSNPAKLTTTDGTAIEGTITYNSTNSDFASVESNGDVLVNTKATGSATITATYTGDDTYASSTASYKITVAPKLTGAGTKANPYTVADAIALVNAGQTPSDNVYVKGIISQLDKYYSNYKQIDYWISDDGKTTKQIEMYNGKGLNNADFSALSDLALGWTVTVYGKLTEYSNTIEMERGNYITSIEKPNVNVPAITGTETFLDKTTVTITADEGSTITYTTDGSDPTTVSGATTTEGNTVSFDITATTTVKAVAMDANANLSSVAEKTFTKTEPITVAEALQKKDGTEVIVKGIVASVSTWNSEYPNVNYWISDDGSTTSELEIFRGTGLNGAKITSQNDITKGDIVILRGKLTTYNNTKELAEGSTLLSITKSDEKATVTAAGWATYVTNNAVSFPEGVTAYTVTYDATADKITLNPVTAVPAKTAVVLKAAAGTYTLTKVESAEAPTSNDLTYSLSDKTIADGDNIYVLAQNNGVIGFWPTEVGSTLAAFKGYLDLGSNSSAKTFFALDGTATGINSINADKANTRDVRFNLAGQRVGKDYKGVVVVNGKKMLVK